MKKSADGAIAAHLAHNQKNVQCESERRYIELGWKILEAKYRYYKLDDPLLQDHEYDAMEREYDTLAKKLNLDPTASDMVGFDETRPSCQVVMHKISGQWMERDGIIISLTSKRKGKKK